MNILEKTKERVACKVAKATQGAACVLARSKAVLADNSGEGYVDTAVKILMAVVIGALVLAGLYALFGETVMPMLTERIKEMFNYGG